MKTSERYSRVIEYFEKERPIANSELNYNNPFELLVAVILSAQCTDKRVNMVTPPLFEAYPDARAMAKASVEDIYGYIKSVSYPNNKSRHLAAMARTLVEMFDGVVPSDVDDLQKLQGVGRKTANVIASVIFNKPTMAVDTHVFRVANRIGLTTNSKTPLQTEMVLTKNIPEEKIPIAHHWLILHGRYVCIARKPKCHECGIAEVCRYFDSKMKKDKQ
ncbi:MAG: endonuclease III [Bacteroidales bacterium]|nr:endonuclease III [Bacteroidales bacterium]